MYWLFPSRRLLVLRLCIRHMEAIRPKFLRSNSPLSPSSHAVRRSFDMDVPGGNGGGSGHCGQVMRGNSGLGGGQSALVLQGGGHGPQRRESFLYRESRPSNSTLEGGHTGSTDSPRSISRNSSLASSEYVSFCLLVLLFTFNKSQ